MLRFLIPSFDIISYAPPGLDIAWLGGIVLDLGSQPSYMHINGPWLNERFVLPYGIEELFAAEHSALSLGEEQEQLELSRAEVQGGISFCHSIGFHVDTQIADVDDLVLSRAFAGSSKDRFHTSDEFLRTEGFGHVVVGTCFEAAYLICNVAFCSQHDDG